MTADYVDGRCCAITRTGKRCNGSWSCYVPCVFAHNPITGESTDGPGVVLCHNHRPFVWAGRLRKGERIRVVRGWLGAANRYGYGTAVFAREMGWKPAAWWWANRKDLKFGETRSDCP